MEEKICNPCKKKVANDKNSTNFMCPNCGKFEIVRCGNCRANAAKYNCPQCGFTGPN